MAWMSLVCAGLLEIVWAFLMKKSQGFTLLGPTVATFIAMAASFWLLSTAMKSLPLGTAYVLWTGIGAVGSFLVGIGFLGEAVTPMRVLAAVLIVVGLVMLTLSEAA